jgi:CDP-diacylglycerol--glycerol-3-phosphate 3-phosphatidyltransferase
MYLRLKAVTSAHYLTFSRILLSPLFVVLYLYYEALGIGVTLLPYLLLFVVVLSELSDIFDGFLARRHNQVTELGKLIDPMADSIFRLSVFLSFTEGLIQLPLLFVLVIFYRDSIISTLRTVCALKGVTLAARLSGKIKAVVHAVIIFFILLLLIPYSLGILELETLRQLSANSLLIGAIYTFYTGVEYIYVNRLFIKKALS